MAGTPSADLARLVGRSGRSIDLEVLHTTATEILPAFVDQLSNVLTVLQSEG